jgi:hypothetical protein
MKLLRVCEMRDTRTAARKMLFGLYVCLSVIAAGGRPAYSAARISGKPLDPPGAINESMYIKIGGIDQWIQIRGRDRITVPDVRERES